MATTQPHTSADWLGEHLTRVGALAAEIRALGFRQVIASGAAESLISYGNAPNWGLDGLQDRLVAAEIREAIEAHLVALARGRAA